MNEIFCHKGPGSRNTLASAQQTIGTQIFLHKSKKEQNVYIRII